MSQKSLPGAPGAWESKAFFAALLAACRNEDEKAANILRKIADSMTSEVLEGGGGTKRTRETRG